MAERDARRFEFGWLEIVGLVLIFVAGSVVVFFLGVFVGKGLQETRIQREERVVRLPVVPPADEKREPARESELPLLNELAQAPGAQPSGSVALGVRRPADAQVPELPLAQTTSDAIAREPGREPTAPAVAPSLLPPRAAATPLPAERISRPTAAAPSSPQPSKAQKGSGAWSVQVNATKDEPLADNVVRQLRERGYNAYLVRVNLQGETWYRVRVGRFPTMEAATAVVMRLKNEERFSRAFLVNE